MSNAGNLRLAFIIEAIDRATATVRAVNQTVEKAAEPLKKVRASMRELFREAGWEKLQKQIEGVRTRGAALADSARMYALGFGALASFAGVAFFGVKRVADEVDRVNDTAAALGMTTQDFQRRGFAAQLNGAGQEEMSQALIFLNKNMGEARSGNQDLVRWFARVGVTMSDLQNRTFTAGDAFDRMADTFHRVGDAGNLGGKKVEASTALLGRSGFRMIQMMNGGSQALRGFYAEADRLGVVLDDETVSAMGAFNDSWDRMRLTLFGAIANALKPVMPLLQTGLMRITEWTAANRGLIATRVGEFVERVAAALPGFLKATSQVASAVFAFAVGADRVAQALGGWQVVLGAIAALLAAKVVVQIIAFIAAIAKAMPIIIGVGKIIFWLATGFAAVFAWPVAIAAALVTAAVIILKHWEPIKQLFSDVGDHISKAGGAAAWVAGLVGKVSGAIARGPSVLWSGAGTSGAPGAAPSFAGGLSGAPNVIAPGGGHMGGTLRIEVDGPARVREVRRDAGSALDFDVYSGMTLSAQ